MSIVQRNWLDFDTQWLSGFRYRIPFSSVPNSNYRVSQGGAVVTDIPLAVHISNGSNGSGERSQTEHAATIFAEVASQWKKIAITTDDGVTQCEVEVAKWDNTNERALLYFLCPSIGSEDAGGNRLSQKFYLYFDGLADDNDTYVGDYTDTTLMQTIWADYLVVFHFQQTPVEDSAGLIKDSSGNSRNGTWRGSDTDIVGDLTKERLGDNCNQSYDFEYGNQNAIQFGGSAFADLEQIAICAMFRIELGNADFLLDYSSAGNTNRKWRIQENAGPLIFQCWDDSDAVIIGLNSSVSLSNGNNKVVHAFYNGGSGLGDAAIWTDLTETQGTPTGNDINVNTDANPPTIGCRSDLNSANHWDGDISEVRISSDGTLFTDSYIAINYHSMLNALWLWQEIEEKPNDAYRYRLPIHIKPDNIDADLYDYTCKIFIGSAVGDDDQDVTAVFDEIGGGWLWRKIRITDSDGVSILPVEVQYWDDQGEFAVLVTKVPFIDSTDGRHLFLYFDSQLPFAGETLDSGHIGSSLCYGDALRFCYHPHKIKPNFPTAEPLAPSYQAFQKAAGSVVSENGSFTDIDDDDFGVDSVYGPYIDIGDGEYISFGEDGWMEGGYAQAFSVEVVVRFPVELSNQQYLFTKRDGVAPFQGWEMHFDQGSDVVRFNFDVGATSSVVRTNTTNVDDNTVRQFVMTYDGSDTIGGLLMFMNGAADRVVDVDNFPFGSGGVQTAIEMQVGARGSVQTASTRFQIFEARLYNRVQISAALIKANYYNLFDEMLRFEAVEELADLDGLVPGEIEFTALPAFHVGFPTIFILPTAENLKFVPGSHTAVVGGRRVFIGDDVDGKKPRIQTAEGGSPQLT